ncbi:hypothetical protein HDV05_001001 [Chytridiales sp. JEL 0842]|nr:hypothetical protein HDV05_001001 [Chytridiales sp. JEL 0842]
MYRTPLYRDLPEEWVVKGGVVDVEHSLIVELSAVERGVKGCVVLEVGGGMGILVDGNGALHSFSFPPPNAPRTTTLEKSTIPIADPIESIHAYRKGLLLLKKNGKVAYIESRDGKWELVEEFDGPFSKVATGPLHVLAFTEGRVV